MFSTTVLDVAAGVIFGFLAISLFTSAAVEAINSLFKLRASDLKSGIMALFNDPKFEGLAKRLYEQVPMLRALARVWILGKPMEPTM